MTDKCVQKKYCAECKDNDKCGCSEKGYCEIVKYCEECGECQ